MTRRLTLYTKEDCHLCQEAEEMLLGLQQQYDFTLERFDIADDESLVRRYGSLVPVLLVERGPTFYLRINEDRLRRALSGETRVAGPTRDLVLFLDRLFLRMAEHWLLLLNTLLGIYSNLPFLAPLLMARGHDNLANAIYFAYSSCHQAPSRSFFLGGYQVAYCQRDMAIYTSLFLCGLLYIPVRRRLKPLPLWAYGLFVLPLAVDGGLQLLGLHFSNWWLRSITGALFGLGSIWLAYPYMEMGFQDIANQVKAKLEKAKSGQASSG